MCNICFRSIFAQAFSLHLPLPPPYLLPTAPSLFSQASEEVSKCLVSMKEILYGSNDKEPHTETVAQLAQELYNSGLLIALVENLQVIDFEVLKERLVLFMISVRIICYLQGMLQ